MTKKKVAKKVGRPKKPKVADAVAVEPRYISFLEKIKRKWNLKDYKPK
tara:strand:+ start:27 stop:170 length:144 start_codon:yes stop_codon:yes gene_type:complete